MTLVLRPFKAEDVAAFEQVRERVRAVDGEVSERRPDELFVAEDNGVAVGHAWSVSWYESDGTTLYLLLGWVDPEYRGRGYGQRILAWQEEQARQHAAANSPAGQAMLGGNADESQQQARALLHAAGYRVAFTRVRMELPLDPGVLEGPEPELPAGVVLRAASAGDHRAVFEGNAAVFTAHSLGYIQDTFEEFEAEVGADYPDYALWTLAWAGDQLAGWVISAPDDIPWVGIRPEWRRRGLASALLRTNHRRLWEYGVRTAALWTVAENPTGSVALYEKLGYRITVRQPRLRKRLSPAG